MTSPHRTDWQLPSGVSRGTWDYTQSERIATNFDEYFAAKPLFELDEQLISHYFRPPGLVVDLGSGTGRALIPMVDKGLRGIAIDLSAHMLRVVRKKSASSGLHIDCVRANLVDLDCLAPQSADYAMCLFSTLGMIRGHKQRVAMVRHVRRLLKPQGKFILQVHNYWVHMFDPDGPWWIVRNAVRRFARRDIEIGDKFFPYRGVPKMFLHTFSRRELRRMLENSGFRILEWFPLNATQSGKLPFPQIAGYLRASGWIVVCEVRAERL